MSWFFKFFGIVLFLGVMLTGYGYYEATSAPIAKRATIEADNWPAGQKPLRIVLIADLQMAEPDMGLDRVQEIMDTINAEKADLILFAGDFISRKFLTTKLYSADETVAPFTKLQAPLGVYAVLGNHDYWADEDGFIAALDKYNIPLLRNEAIKVGPINLIGVDDEYTGRDDVEKTAQSLAKLSKAPNILFTHGPDVVPELTFHTDVVLAGHTHCGQIFLPIIGAISQVSRYGTRFNCGLIEDEGRNVVVTAGLGTSEAPLRIGAKPDYWVITIKGKS